MAWLNNTLVVKTMDIQSYLPVYLNDNNGLWRSNVLLNENDKQLNNVIKYLLHEYKFDTYSYFS